MLLKEFGEVDKVEKIGQQLTCIAQNVEKGTIIEFPYIYYPGYIVTVDGEEKETFESENGFLAVSLPEITQSEISVNYVGTNLMLVSKIISGVTLICIIIYWIFKRYMKCNS